MEELLLTRKTRTIPLSWSDWGSHVFRDFNDSLLQLSGRTRFEPIKRHHLSTVRNLLTLLLSCVYCRFQWSKSINNMRVSILWTYFSGYCILCWQFRNISRAIRCQLRTALYNFVLEWFLVHSLFILLTAYKLIDLNREWLWGEIYKW